MAITAATGDKRVWTKNQVSLFIAAIIPMRIALWHFKRNTLMIRIVDCVTVIALPSDCCRTVNALAAVSGAPRYLGIF